MPTSSITKSPLPWRRYTIAAIAAGSIFAAFLYWKTGDTQDTPAAPSAQVATDVFGPGKLKGSDTDGSLSKGESEPVQLSVPGRLTVAANQELVIDTGLLEVINFFLLEQPNPDRANALQDYLKGKLPPAAYNEAKLIVTHYQQYMKAHDDLLRVQNFDAEDVNARARNVGRLFTWREQRDRLRLDLLGEAVVKAWYQNDDAELNQVLNELQRRNQASNADVNGASSTRDSDIDDGDIQLLLAKATKSFSTMMQEGQLWTTRLAAFQAGIVQIKQQPESNTFQREQQIQQLLEKTFPTEEERQRARDLTPNDQH